MIAICRISRLLKKFDTVKLNAVNIGYHTVCMALQAILNILMTVTFVFDDNIPQLAITYYALQPINLLVMMWLIIKMMHRSTEDSNVRLCHDDAGNFKFIEDNSMSTTRDMTNQSSSHPPTGDKSGLSSTEFIHSTLPENPT